MSVPNAKPTALNLIFLSVLLGPQDPDGWKKYKARVRKQVFYQENKVRVLARNKKWKVENREEYSKQQQIYRRAHQPETNLYLIDYNKARRRSDPQVKLRECLRTRCYKALQQQGLEKDKNTLELLGAPIEIIRAHLEKTFSAGMSWENYGAWQVDHVRPCASFDLRDPEQVKECFHYTNLQALWKRDNLKKGDKWK